MYQCNKPKPCISSGCDNTHHNHKYCKPADSCNITPIMPRPYPSDNKCTMDTSCKHIPQIDLPIAMAYVPYQTFKNVYSLNDGCFCGGTIFKDLEKPFLGRRI